jgi:hypothetical protein
VLELIERVEMRVHFEDHIAAPAAIPAVRTAARREFLASKMHHAVAALAGKNRNRTGIDKCSHRAAL